MIYQRKKFKKIYFITLIILGLLVGALISHFNYEEAYEEAAFTVTLLYGLIIAIPLIIYNLKWNKKFIKKAQEVINILYLDKNPDLYIEKIQELIPENSGIFFDNLRDINLAAGYYYKKDYKKSEELLESVNAKKIKAKNVRAVYYVDLVLTKFHLDKNSEAIKIMDENKKYFQIRNLKGTYNFDASVEFAKCYYYLAKGDNEKARKLALEISDKYKYHYNTNDIEEIKSKVGENNGVS